MLIKIWKAVLSRFTLIFKVLKTFLSGKAKYIILFLQIILIFIVLLNFLYFVYIFSQIFQHFNGLNVELDGLLNSMDKKASSVSGKDCSNLSQYQKELEKLLSSSDSDDIENKEFMDVLTLLTEDESIECDSSKLKIKELLEILKSLKHESSIDSDIEDEMLKIKKLNEILNGLFDINFDEKGFSELKTISETLDHLKKSPYKFQNDILKFNFGLDVDKKNNN